MIRLFLILLSAFWLSACTHLVYDSTERLQVKNLSDRSIRKLSVVGANDTLVWIPEEIAPGELSHVHERDFVGSFRIVFEAKADDIWETVDLGKIRFDGGSELARIFRKDGVWSLKFE